MSLAHDLIDAALAADLTQNELKAFLALLRQTLCYGKNSDHLTLKRLVTITQVRKDRLIPALTTLVEKGLFTQVPHPIFESTYTIASSFTTKYPTIIAPHLPKTRKSFSKSEILSEKEKHTINTITKLNLDNTTLPFPTSFTAEQKQQASQLLDGVVLPDALDCLKILNQVLQQKSLKSPIAYLHQLIKAARNGTLDRNTVSPTPQNPPILLSTLTVPSTPFSSTFLTVPESENNRTDTVKINRLRELTNELYSLDQLYRLTGETMDEATAAKRKKWVEEYRELSTTIGIMQAQNR